MKSLLLFIALLGSILIAKGQDSTDLTLFFDEKNGNDNNNNCLTQTTPCATFSVFLPVNGLVDKFAPVNNSDPTASNTVIFSLNGVFSSPSTLQATLSSEYSIALVFQSQDPNNFATFDSEPNQVYSQFQWNGNGSFSINNLKTNKWGLVAPNSYVWLSTIYAQVFGAKAIYVGAMNCNFYSSVQAIVASDSASATNCVFHHAKDETVGVSGAAIELYGANPYQFPFALDVTNCTFSYNIGYMGGAIFVNATGSHLPFEAIVYSCHFLQNRADNGGAIAILHPSPNISIDSTTFKENFAVHFFDQENTGRGGAVFIGGLKTHPTKDTVQITRNTFESNNALNAGALWMDFYGGDFSGTTFSNNTLPDLNFEDATECKAKTCSDCGSNVCAEGGRGSFLCYGPSAGSANSYLTCNGTEDTGKFCSVAEGGRQVCVCPAGTKGKNCDEPDVSGTNVVPFTTSDHDPGNHPSQPNHTALIVVLTLLGLAVFSGALYGYFYYRSKQNYQSL